MSAFAMATWKTQPEHQFFTLNFTFKLIHVSVAVANFGSLKCVLFVINKYFYYELFEQNQMIQLHKNFGLFFTKVVYRDNHFLHIVGTILKEVSVSERIHMMLVNSESKDFLLSLFQKLQ